MGFLSNVSRCSCNMPWLVWILNELEHSRFGWTKTYLHLYCVIFLTFTTVIEPWNFNLFLLSSIGTLFPLFEEVKFFLNR